MPDRFNWQLALGIAACAAFWLVVGAWLALWTH